MKPLVAGMALLIALCSAVAHADIAATTQPDDSQFVSRREYEALKHDNEQMHAELNELRSEMQKSNDQAASKAAQTQQEIDDEIKVMKDAIDHDRAGFENLAVVGDAQVNFTSQRKMDSSFSATLSPLILWQLNDHLLVEAAMDIDIDSAPDANDDPTSSTTLNLTQANISYIVNDYLLVGGGEFVVPFDQYHNHFDPPWIDKLPDDPLAFDAITPDSEVGLFARGAVPISTSKLTYDVYVTNGPQLVINDPAAAGTVTYNDFTDQNNNKAVGGRIGFLPLPNIEMGYSIEAAKANPDGFPTVRTLLNGVDLSLRQDAPALYGSFDFKTEWAWLNIERATYDPTGAFGFGPLTFSNYSDGGYVQLAYRPLYAGNPIKNFEPVFRWDLLNTPLASPAGDHEQRYAVGLDYWIAPQVVLKAAYEFVRSALPPRENALLLQIGIGL
jgi:hypothetical protein